jgi:uncharacterized delta-60 repeat protein
MTDFAIGIDKAFSLKVNSQGLITVAGFATVSGIAKLAIIQLLEDGNLNTEFGSLGKVIQTIGAGNTFATSLEVDTNGSFYVGAYTLNGSYNSFVVAKFSSLGLLDSTFGQNGITVVSPGTANNYLYSLNILPDGKLLLGGEAVFTDGEKKFATVKLNADGTVDSTFGNAGYNLTQFTDSLSSSGYAMTLNLSEGKYIQVGRTIVNGASQTAIAQYFQ